MRALGVLLLVLLGALTRGFSGDSEDIWTYFPVPEADVKAAEAAILEQSRIQNFAEKVSDRIAFGSPATAGQFPSFASVQRRPGVTTSHVCGGSLIAKNLVLTAAHCFYNSSGAAVVPAAVLLGGTTLLPTSDHKEAFAVDGAWIPSGYVHTDWLKGVPYGDVAILRINGKSSLPIVNLTTIDPDSGTEIETAGFGADENYGITNKRPGKLLYTTLKILKDVKPCDFDIRGVLCAVGNSLSAGKYTSICQGDSGGPVFLPGTNQVVGVNSFVQYNVTRCGENSYTGISSVVVYRRFIDNALKKYGLPRPVDDNNPSPTAELSALSPPPPVKAPLPPPPTLSCAVRSTKPLKNRRYLQGIPASVPAFFAKSYIQCAKVCSSAPSCMMFNFYKPRGFCSLFANATTTAVDLRFKAGYTYCIS